MELPVEDSFSGGARELRNAAVVPSQDSEGPWHPSHQTSNVKCSIIMLSCSRCGWYKYHGAAFLCIPKGCRLVEDEMSVAPGPAGPARNRPELAQARELLRHHGLES
jgi:hypothetical protein